MAQKTVFDYIDYREYLDLRLATHGATRGLRSQLAQLTQTRPAFISQVLKRKNHLSLEHVPPCNQLFGHTADESHFFSLLVLYGRAGTAALEAFIQKQIDEALAKRSNYLERIKASESLAPNQQAIYYSQWFYPIIHVLTSVPEFQSRNKLSERLKLPLTTISSALEALVGLGLVEVKGGKYQITDKRVYLKKDSPWITQMHTNYRNRAIHSFSVPAPNDFHISQVMTLSQKDFLELKKRMIQLLADFEPIMMKSKEEEGFILNVDLFTAV